MTPTLTNERKAAIEEILQKGPPGLYTRADLRQVLIDPDVPGRFLTDEMIGGLLSDVKPLRTDQPEITSDRVDTDEEPDLYVPDSEFPDYATNWDGTVICLGGARKKKGKRMRPYAGWAKTASGKFYPTCYFRLSQNGVRHIQTPAQMLMRRFKTLNPTKPRQSAEETA